MYFIVSIVQSLKTNICIYIFKKASYTDYNNNNFLSEKKKMKINDDANILEKKIVGALYLRSIIECRK